MDVLELLVHLMAEHPSSMVPAFDQKNGVRYLSDQTVQAFQVLLHYFVWLSEVGLILLIIYFPPHVFYLQSVIYHLLSGPYLSYLLPRMRTFDCWL